jgi:hypothetical protein
MKKQEKQNLLVTLNGLERKNKFNSTWDNRVKMCFDKSGSYSFEELISKDFNSAKQLVLMFK